MKLVTVHLPDRYLFGIEKLIELDVCPNRSEAIRIAIRDYLKSEGIWDKIVQGPRLKSHIRG